MLRQPDVSIQSVILAIALNRRKRPLEKIVLLFASENMKIEDDINVGPKRPLISPIPEEGLLSF